MVSLFSLYNPDKLLIQDLTPFGEIMGMAYPAVSALAQRFEQEMEAGPGLKKMAERLEKGIAKRRLVY